MEEIQAKINKKYIENRFEYFRMMDGYADWIENYYNMLLKIPYEFDLYFSPEHGLLSCEMTRDDKHIELQIGKNVYYWLRYRLTVFDRLYLV